MGLFFFFLSSETSLGTAGSCGCCREDEQARCNVIVAAQFDVKPKHKVICISVGLRGTCSASGGISLATGHFCMVRSSLGACQWSWSGRPGRG